MSRRASLMRGVVALAILGALAGAMIVSPVGAAAPLTKAKVKKIAKKEATKVFNSKIGTAKAGDADKLDGLDSNAFQQTDDLLFAVVTDAGSATASLVRGRGATGVGAFFVTDVSFNRTVNNCAWTATAEEDSDNATNAVAELAIDNSTIRVTLTDDAGNIVLGAGETFHLVVVCP
jgi:hypothetical protein